MEKHKIKIYLFLVLTFSIQNSFGDVIVSKDIFKEVSFSDEYSDSGALIKNINFSPVNKIIPQLEKEFKNLLKGRDLKDRSEAHITIITPPEGKTNFIPKTLGIDSVLPTKEMIKMFKESIQKADFEIKCVGMQKNDKGNIVFYLVVESEDIINIRKKIYEIVKNENSKIPFKPTKNYYPHITIGFIGGDVHGVSKGSDTCVADVTLK